MKYLAEQTNFQQTCLCHSMKKILHVQAASKHGLLCTIHIPQFINVCFSLPFKGQSQTPRFFNHFLSVLFPTSFRFFSSFFSRFFVWIIMNIFITYFFVLIVFFFLIILLQFSSFILFR